MEKLGLLAAQPLMGRARDELATGSRILPSGRCVIFYPPIEDGIDVVRVRQSARGIDAVFSDDGQVAPPLVEGSGVGIACEPIWRTRRHRDVRLADLSRRFSARGGSSA